ncbi:hypothetical protein Tco_0105428 [Tanacetum coccineum]
MTTPVEKRNANKFCEFHGEVGHTTDECMHLKRQIEEMLKAVKLSHLIKELNLGELWDCQLGNLTAGKGSGGGGKGLSQIRVDDDLHDLSFVEAEFPAIVINDAFAPRDTFQCKSQVSPINDEFDFRISFDESDDEDYTIICDTNSFSYKMISVNNLKTDSENDYEKVLPSIPSPKPAISFFDDLDFFNDFENEFPAIVYNDAQTSKSDLLTGQHIDEFNDKTSLSEYDEEEQNVLKFGLQDMAPFPPREHRHRFLRYEGLEYTDSDIADFESRLDMIHMREVHRVPVIDFGGLPDLMAEGLTARMVMEHRDEAGVSVFTSKAWRRMFDIKGLLVHELILEFFSTFRFGQAILNLDTPRTLQF